MTLNFNNADINQNKQTNKNYFRFQEENKMKNTIMKRTLSLVLVLMMVFSVTAVSLSTVSAASDEKVTYNFEFYTAGSLGQSNADIVIKVHGTEGSTSTHNVGEVGDSQKVQTASFTDVNVGEITGITANIISTVDDGWYPNYIKVSTSTQSATIYGGRWVDDNDKVTMNVTDNVLKVDVDTCDVKYAGTDGDVKVRFYDTKGRCTDETNLASIHPKFNAFERDDSATFYIYAPSNYGTTSKFAVHAGGDGIFSFGADWKLDSISVTHVSGANTGHSVSKTVNQWIEDGNGTYTFKF